MRKIGSWYIPEGDNYGTARDGDATDARVLHGLELTNRERFAKVSIFGRNIFNQLRGCTLCDYSSV